MEATRGLPTQSNRPILVLSIAIVMLVVPATSGLAGSNNADTAPTTDAAVLPYDGLVPAIEDRFAGQDGVSFAEAIELGKLVGEHQASTLGYEFALDQPVPAHDAPSQAVLALADRYGGALGEEQLDEIQALDEFDEPLRTGITGVIDAFLAFQTGARSEDPGALFAARNVLLDAVGDLQAAVDATPGGGMASSASSCDPIVLTFPGLIFGLLAVDAIGCDATYTKDVVLTIDVGGNDTYHNSAGGGHGTNIQRALVDLGDGTDNYGDPIAPRSFGANGGASRPYSAGFLLDGGGDDTYVAGALGVNGGAWYSPARGFLLDTGGNDTYRAEGGPNVEDSRGANGAGWRGGIGTLLDVGGDDTYTAKSLGANGGAVSGAGLLADLAGDDAYTASHRGTNGHAAGGWLLLPMPCPVSAQSSGDPLVMPLSHCEGPLGVGLLFDQSGIDTYEDDEGGTGTDKTVAPKGLVGAQIDHTPPDRGN